MMEFEQDSPVLSAIALSALADFHAEQALHLEDSDWVNAQLSTSSTLSMDMFSENWNASQFWYDVASASTLAKQLLNGINSETRIAIISTPSVFMQLKNLLLKETIQPAQVSLLEYDERFGVFDEFTYYDFEKPERLDATLEGIFDRIIYDPPYHSVDCHTKYAAMIPWLLKPANSSEASGPTLQPQVIICTGETMDATITKLYPNHFATTFSPSHIGNRLNNKYRCYADFECQAWTRL